jgi:hypothetical protein
MLVETYILSSTIMSFDWLSITLFAGRVASARLEHCFAVGIISVGTFNSATKQGTCLLLHFVPILRTLAKAIGAS